MNGYQLKGENYAPVTKSEYGVIKRAGLVFILFTVFSPLAVFAQSFLFPCLNSNDSQLPVNKINLVLDPSAVDSIHNTFGKKLEFDVPAIYVNRDTVLNASLELHGKTSLIFRRKSFNIKTEKKLPFFCKGDTFRLKHFYAVSMNMDKDYIRNALAFRFLSELHIRTPEHSYAELSLNDAAEGIYMIFKPPHEVALKDIGARIVFRRGYKHIIENEHTRKITPYGEKLIRRKFTDMYTRTIKTNKGGALLKKLDRVLDLRQYFDYLAFNYIFMNGDYSDELYFYWDPVIKKFRIIPWDMDDLFRFVPHEGSKLRNERLGDKLIFSSEDLLDRVIAGDPVLYKAYLKEFENVLGVFSTPNVQIILQDIFCEVRPYFNDPQMIAQSKYDKFGLTSMEVLKKDMMSIYDNLYGRINEVRHKIPTEMH